MGEERKKRGKDDGKCVNKGKGWGEKGKDEGKCVISEKKGGGNSFTVAGISGVCNFVLHAVPHYFQHRDNDCTTLAFIRA